MFPFSFLPLFFYITLSSILLLTLLFRSSIPEVDNITSLALSADSRYVTVNLSSQEIHLWELEKKSLVQHYRGHKQGRFVIRSCFGGANQAFVVSGSEGQSISLFLPNSCSSPLLFIPLVSS
jgi:WD40 repeat protein